MFLSTMHTLPFEGHNVAYQCKVLYQGNIMCEYEVNISTNEEVLTEKQNFKCKMIKLLNTMLNVKVIWRSRS